MKTLSKAIAIASLVSASALTAQVANAEVSFNASVVSDYVWRGFSQTDNGFAIQGGADYSHESGAYAGIWGSNVDFGDDDSIEYDLYVGYAMEVAEGIELDLGYISYNYDDSGNCCGEYYVGASKDAFSAMLSIDADGEYNYLEGGYSMELPEELTLDLHLGLGMPDEGDDVMDLGATIGKSLEQFDVALSVTNEDATDETLVFVSVSKEF